MTLEFETLAIADREAGLSPERAFETLRHAGCPEARARFIVNKVFAQDDAGARMRGALSAVAGVFVTAIAILWSGAFSAMSGDRFHALLYRTDRQVLVLTMGVLVVGVAMIGIGLRYLLLGADRLRK